MLNVLMMMLLELEYSRLTMIIKIEDSYANSTITTFNKTAKPMIMNSIHLIRLAIRGGCTMFPCLKNQTTYTKAIRVTASPSITQIYTQWIKLNNSLNAAISAAYPASNCYFAELIWVDRTYKYTAIRKRLAKNASNSYYSSRAHTRLEN